MEIKTITNIHKIIETQGSGPLYCTLSNGKRYYCKRSIHLHPPYTDLINEVLLNYIFRFANVPIPIIDLAKLNYFKFKVQLQEMYNEIRERYTREGRYFIPKYPFKPNHFDIPLFASQEIAYSSFIYDLGIEKLDIQSYLSPIDIVKIGFIDYWVYNTDRSPNNTNLLSTLSPKFNKLAIVPIDHCRTFGNVPNYTQFYPSKTYQVGSILKSNFGKFLLQTIPKEDLRQFLDVEISSYIRQAEVFVLQTKEFVPDEWQFDEDQMDAVIEVLQYPLKDATLIKNFRNTYIKPIRNDV